MDVSQDALVTDDHIDTAQTPLAWSSTSRPEDVAIPRRNPISLSLEAHPQGNGANDDDHLVPTVKELPMSAHPEFKIHWAAPVGMIAFFICGVSFATGHHVCYSSLDGTEVRDDESQQWAIRFGTAFAFLVEVPLAAAVSIAQTQRAWTTLERKAVAIGAIDSIFAATRDLGSFMSWEMKSRAKIASLLALICWCLPLSALVTPATLTVQAVSRIRNVDQIVPAIDFNNVTKFALLTTSDSDPTSNVLQWIFWIIEDRG